MEAISVSGKSVRTFAIEHKLSIARVYQKIWEGRLRAKKVGRRWVILPDVSRPDADTAEPNGEGGN